MASEGGSSSPWLGLIAGAAMGAYGAYTIAKSAGALHKVDTSQRGYTVVITGSTRGLGRAMAQEFLTYGDKVVVNGRSLESVARTVEELKRAAPDGAEVLGFAADVADAAAVQKMADAAKREFGSIDFWINNAGMSQAPRAALHETPPATVEKILRANLLGALNGARAAARVMLGQAAGRAGLDTRGLIFFVEGAGSRGGGTPMSAAYGASKAALPQLTKSLKKELRAHNIGVHQLSPGMVMTDLLLSGSRDNARALKVFNILAEQPESVAKWIVPRIRGVKTLKAEPIRFLTPPGVAYRFLTAQSRKDRLVVVP